jgi:hypothetical protein
MAFVEFIFVRHSASRGFTRYCEFGENSLFSVATKTLVPERIYYRRWFLCTIYAHTKAVSKFAFCRATVGFYAAYANRLMEPAP